MISYMQGVSLWLFHWNKSHLFTDTLCRYRPVEYMDLQAEHGTDSGEDFATGKS